jgi:hypothetical protein
LSDRIPVPDESVAVVTPSYAGDFEICRLLNEGVLSFFPHGVKHYIIVDRADLRLFSALRDSRVTIVAKEDLVPGLRHIPATRRWFVPGTLLPVHGWLVQQIVKIAATEVVRERLLIFADSDVMIARPVDCATFFRDGKPRLFCRPGGITSTMTSHVQWYQTACRLLDVPPVDPPMEDYIGQIVTWDRDLSRQMRAHVEKVACVRWVEAVTRSRRFSEYLLYGIFVDRVLGREGSVWPDSRPLCHEHWKTSPISADMVPSFVGSMSDDDLSVMVTSHSPTSLDVRKAIFALARAASAR